MVTALCLDCDKPIDLSKPVEGQLVRCENCGAEWEVISVDPLELDWAYLEPAEDEEDEDRDWHKDAGKDWEEEKVRV